jgi:sec-independent protein translocase protein TatA
LVKKGLGEITENTGGDRMFGLSMQELMAIMAIVLVLFGAIRIPELGSGLGKAVKNFKQGMNEVNKAEIEEKKTAES